MSVSALLNGILDITVKKLNTKIIKSIDNLNITAPKITLSSNSIGRVVMQAGQAEVVVDVDGMNTNAIILATPMNQIVDFWVIPDDDKFTIYTDGYVGSDVMFSYFVLNSG